MKPYQSHEQSLQNYYRLELYTINNNLKIQVFFITEQNRVRKIILHPPKKPQTHLSNQQPSKKPYIFHLNTNAENYLNFSRIKKSEKTKSNSVSISIEWSCLII